MVGLVFCYLELFLGVYENSLLRKMVHADVTESCALLIR
jgi:hypothetical protein